MDESFEKEFLSPEKEVARRAEMEVPDDLPNESGPISEAIRYMGRILNVEEEDDGKDVVERVFGGDAFQTCRDAWGLFYHRYLKHEAGRGPNEDGFILACVREIQTDNSKYRWDPSRTRGIEGQLAQYKLFDWYLYLVLQLYWTHKGEQGLLRRFRRDDAGRICKALLVLVRCLRKGMNAQRNSIFSGYLVGLLPVSDRPKPPAPSSAAHFEAMIFCIPGGSNAAPMPRQCCGMRMSSHA